MKEENEEGGRKGGRMGKTQERGNGNGNSDSSRMRKSRNLNQKRRPLVHKSVAWRGISGYESLIYPMPPHPLQNTDVYSKSIQRPLFGDT